MSEALYGQLAMLLLSTMRTGQRRLPRRGSGPASTPWR